MINRQILEGHWNQLKGRVRQKWGQLSDSDIAQFRGDLDELIGTIQQKTGEGRDAVEGFLQQLSDSAATVFGQGAEATRQHTQRAMGHISEELAEAKCWVRDRPAHALTVCFGFGVLVGLIIAITHRK